MSGDESLYVHVTCSASVEATAAATVRTNDHPEDKKDVKVKSVCRKTSQ